MDAIKSMGADVRLLIEKNNGGIKGNPENYRYIPKEYFLNFCCLIYENNYAICDEINQKATIYHNTNLAESQRRLFEWLWSVAEEIKGE
jgi:hypothetical protein